MTDTSGLLRRLPLLAILIAALYTGWILYSRWSAARDSRNAAAAHEIERARRDVELNGGSQLKITMLYATSPNVAKGQPAQICYGVVNARSVAFDPPIDSVWPSVNRCVEVTPHASTTYTLTATDAAGHTEKAQLALNVK